jgi:hypothetical protein
LKNDLMHISKNNHLIDLLNLILPLIYLSSLTFLIISCSTKKVDPHFVGGKECISCHQNEYNLWKNSDHDRAMMIANDSTVLGDFNNVEIESREETQVLQT